LIFVFSGKVFSQITITQADMPQPGDTIRLSTTTDTNLVPTPALTGAGITWDYSKLVRQSQTIDTFISVTSTPIAYQLYFNDGIFYPNYKSTVAQAVSTITSFTLVTINKVINFYKDESNNYESVGYGATINSIPASVKDDTIDVVYNFPLTYGNKDSCHSSNHLSIPKLLYYGQSQYRVNNVEGWGTLITPFGTYPTVKVKTLIYASDTVYLDTLIHFGFKIPQPEQIQYKWLTNGQHVPLLQINERMVGNVPTYLNTVYRDSARKSTVGITEANQSFNNLTLYPNPTNENTTLNYQLTNSSLVNIGVYSVDGRCVLKTFNGEQNAGTHTMNLNVENLQPGIYLIRVESGGQEAVKKLVVIR